MEIVAYSEAETRQEIIDKRLNKAGWKVKDPLMVTEELDIYLGDGMKLDEKPVDKYKDHLFSDYALLADDRTPLAVVEAKKTSVDAEVGKEQARNYAQKIKEKLKIPMPFVFYTNGDEIFFWDTERYPPRKVHGFPSRADLERMKFLRENARELSSEYLNTKIAGRPYQIEAARAVIERIQKNRRKFLLVMATGTGKTRNCMSIIDLLMKANTVQRVLFLVDRIALQSQALDAFKEFLPNTPIWPKSGEEEFSTDRRIYVMTYPAMLNIIEQDNSPLSPFFFDLIVADESHRSIYKVYKNILDYFDAMQLGLTATPTDHIDHNTFQLFECDNGRPAFSYDYETAKSHKPPYLNDFEVVHVRTKFQEEGINTKTISETDKKKMIAEGKDPDEYDFTGSELEEKISNKGTNTVIVREFMNECIKSPDEVLPGKTIIFAVSKKHAYRLNEVFDSLYPEYKGRLAEVIISDVKGVHGKGGLLDRFKNNDMPRVAISVDMLDTGIDILEVVNLVFAKPVFSYTKFWQMIGRGTRVLDQNKIKEWCPKKDKFLILDCWKNFEFFKIKPPGKIPGADIPLPVRLFRARLDKLEAAVSLGNKPVRDKIIKRLKADIENLPAQSVVVMEGAKPLRKVKETNFWADISKKDIDFLRLEIAPIMKAYSGVDFKAMVFERDMVELSAAKLVNDTAKYDTLVEGVKEVISEIPLTVNIVKKEEPTIEKCLSDEFWPKATDDELDDVTVRISPLMKFREKVKPTILREDLEDLLAVKKKIKFGAENASLPVTKYREEAEAAIRELLKTNPVLQKLVNGGELSEQEINSIAEILKQNYPNITEFILREVYDNKTAKFVQFLKHILNIEPLASFEEEVTGAFDEFIRKHNTYSQKQIQFLNVLKSFILQRGTISKAELMNDPFTRLHERGILGVFKQSEINEILGLISKVA